jgi:hypothetical protein
LIFHEETRAGVGDLCIAMCATCVGPTVFEEISGSLVGRLQCGTAHALLVVTNVWASGHCSLLLALKCAYLHILRLVVIESEQVSRPLAYQKRHVECAKRLERTAMQVPHVRSTCANPNCREKQAKPIYSTVLFAVWICRSAGQRAWNGKSFALLGRFSHSRTMIRKQPNRPFRILRKT